MSVRIGKGKQEKLFQSENFYPSHDHWWILDEVDVEWIVEVFERKGLLEVSSIFLDKSEEDLTQRLWTFFTLFWEFILMSRGETTISVFSIFNFKNSNSIHYYRCFNIIWRFTASQHSCQKKINEKSLNGEWIIAMVKK